jgi:hypothetical protein
MNIINVHVCSREGYPIPPVHKAQKRLSNGHNDWKIAYIMTLPRIVHKRETGLVIIMDIIRHHNKARLYCTSV